MTMSVPQDKTNPTPALLAVLGRLYESLETLERTLEEKRQVIIASDMDKLAEIDGHIEQLGQAISELDVQRRNCLLPLGLQTQRLSNLPQALQAMVTLSQTDKTQLEQYADNFTSVLKRIEDMQRRNATLLEATMAYTAHYIQLIMQAVAPTGEAYGPTGASKKPYATQPKANYHPPTNPAFPSSTMSRTI